MIVLKWIDLISEFHMEERKRGGKNKQKDIIVSCF
jgi:hypothetical protein